MIHFDPEILLKAQNIKILFLDVDGVLTDGGVYFTEEGETIKRFDTQDGFGIRLLIKAGIEIAVISGRDSQPLRTRLKGLGITKFHLGNAEKLPFAEKILKELNLNWIDAGVMGDDWPDAPLFSRAKFSAAPRGAHYQIAQIASYQTKEKAGHGAVREVCDLILTANGQYISQWEEWENK